MSESSARSARNSSTEDERWGGVYVYRYEFQNSDGGWETQTVIHQSCPNQCRNKYFSYEMYPVTVIYDQGEIHPHGGWLHVVLLYVWLIICNPIESPNVSRNAIRWGALCHRGFTTERESSSEYRPLAKSVVARKRVFWRSGKVFTGTI
jgi:hypothetical protein